jgi:hypothetical protein
MYYYTVHRLLCVLSNINHIQNASNAFISVNGPVLEVPIELSLSVTWDGFLVQRCRKNCKSIGTIYY